MKKIYLTLLTILSLFDANAQVDLDWVVELGGTEFDTQNSMTYDSQGNIYSTGYYTGTADFDPGLGVFDLIATYGNDTEAYVSKIDTNGNFVWAKSFSGAGLSEGLSIFIDDFGNALITGYYTGTVDFDPGPGTLNLTSVANEDIFIVKLDPIGNLLWAKSIGGNEDDRGTSIVTDGDGNIYTTGSYEGTVDFDPNIGTTYLTGVGFGNTDIFITKLDTNGNLLWANRIGTTYNDEEGKDITTDDQGNIYTVGTFSSSMDFDPNIGTNYITPSGGDMFIQKLDSSGNFVWVKTMGGASATLSVIAINIDDFGNIITTGAYSGTIDFDPSPAVYNLPVTATNGAFVSKLDANGNFVWARDFSGGSVGYDVTSDASGSIYIMGQFTVPGDFDPGVGIFYMQPFGVGEIFTAKLSASGNFVWAYNQGSSAIDFGRSIFLDANNNVYSGGYFRGICNFHPAPGYFTLYSSPQTNAFICKIKQCRSAGSDIRTVCDSLTWIDGNLYTSSNNTATFNIVGGSVNGCDSLVTLDLTVNNSSSGIDTRTECDSLIWIDGITYSSNNNTATFNIVAGNSNGCDSLAFLNLTISNLDANYSFTDNGNGDYSFNNTSTGSYNQSHWGFGDGTIDSIANPNHTFTTNGIFTVILTINDSTVQGDSCISYYLDTINVTGVTNPLPCNSGFVIYPDTTGNITIVNNATGNNLTYLWDFGDGNTSILQNPSHTYVTAEPFYLCLTIDDGNGCTEMYCDSVGKNGVIFNKAGGFTINVSSPNTTGIDNNTDLNSEVNIYPNPTSSQLTIDTEMSISEIKIIDITGKSVKTIMTDFNIVDLSNLTNGIYFIKIINKEGSIIKKFVKQ